MAQSTTKHIHKLRRHKYKSGNIIYFCTLPDCNYKVSPALAVGKRSLCNICGNEFILTDYAVRLAKPHCEECHKPKAGTAAIDALADKIKFIDSISDLPDALASLSMDEIIEDQVTEGTKYTSSSLAERLAKASHKLEEDEEDEDEI